jgi:tetratricopeptide (TPR) repeat protein
MTRNMFVPITFLIFFLAGCAGLSSQADKAESALVIPTHPTAQSQYGFAKVYHNSQLISPELSRRKAQMARISSAYEKVVQNFPQDTQFTPLAMMEMGDCAAQADEMAKARGYYAQARAAYPQNEYVQARVLFSEGKLLEAEGKFVESKAVFKQVMDRFGKSESVRVRDVAQRASTLYYQVRDSAAAPKAKGGFNLFGDN